MIRNILALMLVAGSLAACNTMEGLGEDIEAGGENLQESSNEVHHDMKHN